MVVPERFHLSGHVAHPYRIGGSAGAGKGAKMAPIVSAWVWPWPTPSPAFPSGGWARAGAWLNRILSFGQPLYEVGKEPVGIDAQGVGDDDKLDHVDTTLSTLNI